MREETTMVCRDCGLVLNRYSEPGRPDSVEWRHPWHRPADHAPDPVPLDEAVLVRPVCDFCGGDPSWVYHTRSELIDTKATPTFTGRDDRRRISRHWERVQPEQGAPTEHSHHVYSTGWAACSPCAEMLELRDMERLITRLRRLRPDTFAAVSRNVLRDQYRPLFASISHREPIDTPR